MDVEGINDWLHEGDILITSCFMCTCLAEKFINTLYQKQVSGIIIHKLYEEYTATEQKNLLMNYRVPLVFIEDSVPQCGMIVLIQDLAISSQTQYFVKNRSFQNSIISCLSKNYTLSSLCEIVYNLTQVTTAIADYNLRLQDGSNDNNWNTELYNLKVSTLYHRTPIGENFSGVTMNGYRYRDIAINGEYQYFIIPSRISEFTSAFLIIIKYRFFAETLSPESIYRLETVESIYSLKNSITVEFEKSNYYSKSAISKNLPGMSYEDRTWKKQIGLSLNTELSGDYYPLLISSHKNLNIFSNVGLLTGFINYLKHIKLYSNKFLVFLHKEQWVAPIDDKVPSTKVMGIQLYNALSTYSNSSHFTMGISDLRHYWDLGRASNEATFTISYAKNKQNNVCLLVYEELGVIKLFTNSNGSISGVYLSELYQFYLKLIMDYDKKHSSDLYLTLKYFFSNKLSYKMTGEKLFIHVNTLHARIARIGSLIHVSFPNPDSIIGLRLTILLGQFNYSSYCR